MDEGNRALDPNFGRSWRQAAVRLEYARLLFTLSRVARTTHSDFVSDGGKLSFGLRVQ